MEPSRKRPIVTEDGASRPYDSDRVRPDAAIAAPEEPQASPAGLPLESRTVKPTLSLAASAHRFTIRRLLPRTYTWSSFPLASLYTPVPQPSYAAGSHVP